MVSDDEDVEPVLAPVQMTTMAVESLCPPVVAQTRPKEGCDPASPRRLRRGRDVLREDSMLAVDTRRLSIDQVTDVVSGIYVMPDCIQTVMPMLVAAPQAASEVAQMRHRGDCSVNLLLPVDRSIEPLDDAPEILSSEREPAGGSSEVGSDVCVVQDLLPTVVSVRTVVAEMRMERFVLVPEAYPVVSMASMVARTFGPALSEEYSPVVLAGGGGAVAAAHPLVVVESDTARVSVLPMVESDTARVSVLPVAGSKFPAVFWGKVALDVVGLDVGPPCLQVDSEETLPASIDERAEINYTVPGVTPDGGPLEGTPVLEPLEHSGLEMSLHDKHMVEAPVLEPLEHSFLEKPLDGGSLEGRPVVDWFV